MSLKCAYESCSREAGVFSNFCDEHAPKALELEALSQESRERSGHDRSIVVRAKKVINSKFIHSLLIADKNAEANLRGKKEAEQWRAEERDRDRDKKD